MTIQLYGALMAAAPVTIAPIPAQVDFSRRRFFMYCIIFTLFIEFFTLFIAPHVAEYPANNHHRANDQADNARKEAERECHGFASASAPAMPA